VYSLISQESRSICSINGSCSNNHQNTQRLCDEENIKRVVKTNSFGNYNDSESSKNSKQKSKIYKDDNAETNNYYRCFS
jgi:hypothetical protein